VFEALVRHTTPVAKPDCIEEPSVTTATVTMSRSLRDLGGSMALRRGVVLVVVAESIEADSILAHSEQAAGSERRVGGRTGCREPGRFGRAGSRE
jgi:hypothetical protein